MRLALLRISNNWNHFELLKGKISLIFSIILLAVLSLWYLYNQIRDEENHLAIEERWEWDGEVIGLMLKDGFEAKQPLLAIEPAGVVPYFSELPSLLAPNRNVP